MAELVAIARRRHPTAQALAAARREADARVVQAGAWANPTLELSYGRTRPRIDDLQSNHPYGVSLSQRVEWWGKRRARIDAAQADVAFSTATAAASLIELEIDVRLAAIAYAAAQEAVTQAGAQAALADQLSEVITKRHAAGDSDRGEVARMRVEASTARVRHEAAIRAVATALAVLRTWCGESLSTDITITDVFADTASLDPTTETANEHPRLQAALAAERASAARGQTEREARVPDVTIGVFGEQEWEKNTLGVTLGVEVPLWNRNAGGIAAADAEHDRLKAARFVEALRLQRERTEALGAWQAARAEASTLRSEALPAAEDAVRLRTTAFASGEASLADVLDSRRALLNVQTYLLDAQRRAAESQVRLLAATAGAGSHP